MTISDSSDTSDTFLIRFRTNWTKTIWATGVHFNITEIFVTLIRLRRPTWILSSSSVLVSQVAAVREGMSWIVPVPLLSLLTAKQLEQMVCGMPEICCDVLKKVVRYREVDEQHSLVQWFWQTLEEFSNEERVLFMRFVSGRSRLPANTADISQRFQIMKVDRVSPSGRGNWVWPDLSKQVGISTAHWRRSFLL